MFPPLIVLFNNAVLAYKAQKLDVNTGSQQLSTQTVKEVKNKFGDMANLLDNQIKASFPNQPGVYFDFFPKNLSQTKKTKKGEIEEVLENWRLKALARQAVLGAALVTDITDLKTEWASALLVQSGSTHKVKTARVLLDPAWQAVAEAAYTIILALAAANPQNLELLDAYFDMSIFAYAQNPDTDGKASLTGSVKHSVTGEFIAEAQLTFTHIGSGKVYQFKTNSLGLYSHHGMKLGLYTLTASAGGYMSFTGQANLLDASNPPLDLTLLQLGEPGQGLA